MGPRGVPTYPLGIAERRHRNLLVPYLLLNLPAGARALYHSCTQHITQIF
jgi:hypothetical protein